ESSVLEGTWPEQMVDLSICCSEHDVSRCFSAHGGTLLMSWRSWPEPVSLGRPIELNSSIFGNMEGFLYRNISIFWRKGVVPGTGPRVLSSGDPGRLLAGTRGPVSYLGSGGIQYLRLRELHRSIKFPLSLEYDVGSLHGPSNFLVSSAQMYFRSTCSRHASVCMCLVCSCTLDSDDFFSFMKMRRCPHGGDWSELALDGEAGNVCIKGDASFHNPDTCAASVPILGLSSGRTSFQESCGGVYGSGPRNLRGRILARLRIRGMRKFNKTRRPKSRILMLDSAGLACTSWACKSCNGLSFRSSWGTFGMFVLLPGDNLVDSWCRSRSLGHSRNPKAGWTFVQEPGGWKDYRPGTRRLDRLLSRNPKAGRTIVLEPVGWMDYHPGTRRRVGLTSWNPAGWTIVLEPGGWMDYRPETRRLDELLSRNPMVVWTFKGTFSYIFMTRSRLHRVGFLEKCFPLSYPGSVFQCVFQLQLGRLKDRTIYMDASHSTFRRYVTREFFPRDSRSLLWTRKFNGWILRSNGTVELLHNPGGTFGMFVLLPGDNLVDSWCRSRSLGHEVGHNRCWDDLASCFHGTRRTLGMLFQNLKIHPSETHGSWMRFFINWRLYGLSSRNPEAEWTLVPKPEGWMDFRPGTRRLEGLPLDGLSSWNPETGWINVLEPGGWMNYRPGTRRLVGLSSWNPEAGWTIVLKPGGWMNFCPGTRWLCGPSKGPSRRLFGEVLSFIISWERLPMRFPVTIRET
ncbi:LOW QUALITY PROTEIN: hypothetical protein HID58_055432, partial [Brassica napus]